MKFELSYIVAKKLMFEHIWQAHIDYMLVSGNIDQIGMFRLFEIDQDRLVKQFDGLDFDAAPDPDDVYECARCEKCGGFTLLMKWILLASQNIDISDHIKKYLAQNPTEINRTNTAGWTALMIACENYRPHMDKIDIIIKILIDAGADVNIQSIHGYTALMRTCQKSNINYNILRILLAVPGIDVNLVNVSNNSAMVYLCNDSDNLDAVELLLQAGATTNSRGGCGHTAIMRACSSKKDPDALINRLMDKGASLDMLSDFSETPLILACGEGDVGIATLARILNATSNINHRDKFEKTAATVACQRGHIDVVKLLLGRGADLYAEISNNKDFLEKTLHNAQLCRHNAGFNAIIELLLKMGAVYHINEPAIRKKILTRALNCDSDPKIGDAVYRHCFCADLADRTRCRFMRILIRELPLVVNKFKLNQKSITVKLMAYHHALTSCQIKLSDILADQKFVNLYAINDHASFMTRVAEFHAAE